MYKVFAEIKKEWNEWRSECNLLSKHNMKLFLIAFFILLFCFSSILRANYNYIDDVGRNIFGSREWGRNFARWITVLFNLGLQGNPSLVDVSPYIQYIAIVFLAFSILITSFIFSRLNNSKVIKKKIFAASFLIALNPYFLECLSYKYDSIGMGFSVMISIVPFIFIGYKSLYSISSLICLILMCLSYQASSGIYIVFVLFSGFVLYSKDHITFSEYVIFCLKSAILYIIALCLFYLCFIPLTVDAYRSTSFAFKTLIPTIINNGFSYLNTVNYDFNIYWKIILFALVIADIIVNFISIKRNRLSKTIILIGIIILSSFLSYGAYLALEKYAGAARMIYGIGIFIAMLGLLSSLGTGKAGILNFLLCILLLMLFISYSCAYGNALSIQNEYEKSIEQLILTDINMLDNGQQHYKILLQYSGNPYSPVVQHVISRYPITSRLVPALLTFEWWWSGFHLAYYNGFEKLPENFSFNLADYELVVDRMKYDIYRNNEVLVIIIKY